METIRIDPIANHAGENVSFVQTNYNDSAWRQFNLPHDWVVELPFDSERGRRPWFQTCRIFWINRTNNIGWYRHTFTLPAK